MKSLLEMGIKVPDILLPKTVDTATWAAIACDQHTSEKAYWTEAQKIAGDNPSTLHLMLPEAYLNDDSKENRILDIHRTMKKYLDEGLFASHHGFVYVERLSRDEAGREATRRGIMAAIDLEAYDWNPEAHALIRATEATIPERIPPRVAIREGAMLDIPHVMLLANDPDGLLIEAAGQRVHEAVKENKCAPLYDGDLMLGGGHITGYLIDSEGEECIKSALNTLYEAGRQEDGSVLLFAVGDGNHSLATAKTVWEKAKQSIPKDEWLHSPVRYALVEIVNLYDDALVFEPIHRVLFNVDAIDFLAALVAELGGEIKEMHTEEEMLCRVHEGGSIFGVVVSGRYAVINASAGGLSAARHGGGLPLPVAQIQGILDDYLRDGSKGRADYIHGDKEAIALAGKDSENTVSILLPPVSKDGLFQTIAARGSLPRKSFSMGDASQKRYYMECKRLFDND